MTAFKPVPHASISGEEDLGVTHLELPSIDDVDQLSLRWSEESQMFRSALRRYPDKAMAFRHVGLNLWKDGMYELAAYSFKAALSLQPTNPLLWAELAGACVGLPDPKSAELCIVRSLEIDSSRSQPWLTLADLLSRRDDLDGAAHAYGRAIAIEPAFASSYFGLGIVLFRKNEMEKALESMATSVRLNPGDALAHTCLGHISYKQAKFAESIAAFGAASSLTQLDLDSRRTLARATTFQTVIEGETQQALATYQGLPSEEREDVETVLREGFALLSAFGHVAAAAEIGRVRLMRDPADPVQRYLQDAVTGQSLTVASPEYIERHFDDFAPRFDEKLVNGLNYRGPSRLIDLISKHRTRFSNIADVGCGTGLAADLLAKFACPLAGVDLSGGMLEQAARRGRYTSLIKVDVVTYLAGNAASFDLIFAADLLVYLGDLEPFMLAAASALVPGGLLALSVETTEKADFQLLPSGRFAHRPGYIESLCSRNFHMLEISAESIRLEINRPVAGQFLLLERRS